MNHLLEPHWIDAFEQVIGRCGVQPGDEVVMLTETQSRADLPELARHACARLKAKSFTLTMPTRQSADTPIIRSTGASTAIDGLRSVIAALSTSTLVIDCTVEGLMHAAELASILQAGSRVLYISPEHPEALCRLMPTDALEAQVKAHMKRLRSAKDMRVSSHAGTNLHIRLQGAPSGANWGTTSKPGTITHWPGGLVLAFPTAGSVNGTLVLNTGDVNLAFKRYIEQPTTLTIENDHVTRIDGSGVDAQLMREYFAAWNDREGNRNAYAVSHVGYGLNPLARFDSMAMFDKRDFNGTELRAVAGSFLYSTGANETAGRYTLGHFDVPMKACTIRLDDALVVDEGRLLSPTL